MPPQGMRMDDDLVAKYAAEAKAAMEAEAARRVAESTDPEEEERLRNTSLHELLDSQHLVPALLARLGAVRAALDGHGGGIAVSLVEHHEEALDLVLDLTGACLSCGAAPGVHRIRFSSALLDTFDDLGREFILAHGKVEFVDVPTDGEPA